MIKHSALACALVAALFVAPATAHADDPAPTVDQVVAIVQQLTDPDIPAASKGNIVLPPFSPEEAATIDDHLHRMQAANLLPLSFVVTVIEPAPDNSAGATLSTTGSFHQYTRQGPVVLVDRDGRWLVTHDTAMTAMTAFWHNATRHKPVVPGNSF